MSDENTITVIDFSVKPDAIENLDSLPPKARAKFDEADAMSVRGFQEVNGYKDRKVIWSCHGHWTSREPDAKFHISSMGDGSMLFDENKNHDVVADGAGWNLSHARLTCRTPGCNCATLVHQPYMNSTEWEAARKAFLQKHPCLEVRPLGDVF